MSRHVLVPMDRSKQAEHALEHALGEFEDARFTFLHVINPAEAGFGAQAGIPSYSEEWYEEAKADAEELLSGSVERAEERSREAEMAIAVGEAAGEIADYAEENDIDHIVIGSHGRSGVTRILLGSVAETVVRRSPMPVTVVR